MVVENLSSGHDLLGGTVTELFDLLIGVVVDERAPVGLDVLFVARTLNVVAISLDDISSDRQRCQEDDEGPNHDVLMKNVSLGFVRRSFYSNRISFKQDQSSTNTLRSRTHLS